MRYGFGKNWKDFIAKNFDDTRVSNSRKHILEFLEVDSLEGHTFLDIGCGSGLSSLAAYTASASRIFGFDYDPDSVSTSQYLRDNFGSAERWHVEQGSVLDEAYMASLEPADIVYSWGVLHHTGDQWNAIRLAASKVKPGGLFYIALYTTDVFVNPTPEFWLAVKQKYVRANSVGRVAWEAWYIWNFTLGRRIWRLPSLIKRMREYQANRGMSFMTDIRDWLGGWPMEFSSVQEVKDFVGGKLGLEFVKMNFGEANTEYLFRRPE